jgi:hypothetical protein
LGKEKLLKPPKKYCDHGVENVTNKLLGNVKTTTHGGRRALRAVSGGPDVVEKRRNNVRKRHKNCLPCHLGPRRGENTKKENYSKSCMKRPGAPEKKHKETLKNGKNTTEKEKNKLPTIAKGTNVKNELGGVCICGWYL